MEFSLTTLGSASAKPMVDRSSSVHVLNARGRLFLIDCCEGAQFQLVRHGFSLMKFDNIMISHLHGDHVFGIFGLLSTLSLMGRTADLHIYAPRDFSSIVNFYLGHFGEGVKYGIVHHPLTLRGCELICSSKTADVFAFPLNHGIDTFGFLFREKWPEHPLAPTDRYERSIAYCCDTAPFPALEEHVRGVDILLHEATYMDNMREVANARYHSTAVQAAELARRADVGKLIAAHFSSRYRDPDVILQEARAIFPQTFLACEGERFNVPYRRLNEEKN